MMSLDGQFRPTQLYHYSDALSVYSPDSYLRLNPVQRTVEEAPKSPRTKKRNKKDKESDSRKKQESDSHPRHQRFSSNERDILKRFAELRGIQHLVLEDGVEYLFERNLDTGFVDLIRTDLEETLMSLTVVELQSLVRQLDGHQEGLITETDA